MAPNRRAANSKRYIVNDSDDDDIGDEIVVTPFRANDHAGDAPGSEERGSIDDVPESAEAVQDDEMVDLDADMEGIADHSIRDEPVGMPIYGDGNVNYAEDGDSPITRKRNRFTAILADRGLFALAQDVLGAKSEAEDLKTLGGLDEEQRCIEGYAVCATTDPTILKALTEGTLMHEYRKNPGLRTFLSEMRVRTMNDKHPQPAIYINVLVDESALSPTPNELLKAAAVVQGYIAGTDDDLARKIDSFIPPVPTQNRTNAYSRRKYLLSKKKGKESRSDTREKNISDFIKALRTRLYAIPESDRDLSLRHPLIEIGYTHKSAKRLSDHKKHRSSNYAMNLMDAVCGVQWPNTFKITQFVVFLCCDAAHATISEIFFTRLAQGYTENGGGFSHCAAGRSNRSALKYTSSDWAEFYKWTEAHIPVQTMHEKEQAIWAADKFSAQKGLSAESARSMRTVVRLDLKGVQIKSLEEEYLRRVKAKKDQELAQAQQAALKNVVENVFPVWEEIGSLMVDFLLARELMDKCDELLGAQGKADTAGNSKGEDDDESDDEL